MENKKKVEIHEKLLKEVSEEHINEILKEVEDAEKDLGINQEVTKEVLKMMKGKRLFDLSNTIIALAQCTPFSILHSVYSTLGTMLKTDALKALLGLGKAEVEEDTTSKEDE